MSKRYAQIGPYIIYWDEIYYIAYSGGKRELPAKDQKLYEKTLLLPEVLKRKELKKLGPAGTPFTVPIKGIDLLEIIKDAGYTPFFDRFFNESKMIQVNNSMVYESMKQKSYDLFKGI